MRASAWRSAEVARPRLVHEGAEGVVDLHRVDAQVDVRHREAVGAQQARDAGNARFDFASGAAAMSCVEQRDQRLGGDEVVAVRRA